MAQSLALSLSLGLPPAPLGAGVLVVMAGRLASELAGAALAHLGCIGHYWAASDQWRARDGTWPSSIATLESSALGAQAAATRRQRSAYAMMSHSLFTASNRLMAPGSMSTFMMSPRCGSLTVPAWRAVVPRCAVQRESNGGATTCRACMCPRPQWAWRVRAPTCDAVLLVQAPRDLGDVRKQAQLVPARQGGSGACSRPLTRVCCPLQEAGGLQAPQPRVHCARHWAAATSHEPPCTSALAPPPPLRRPTGPCARLGCLRARSGPHAAGPRPCAQRRGGAGRRQHAMGVIGRGAEGQNTAGAPKRARGTPSHSSLVRLHLLQAGLDVADVCPQRRHLALVAALRLRVPAAGF